MTELTPTENLPASEYYMKPTATIHIGNNLTFIERKLFNLLIWHSQVSRFTVNKEPLMFDELMRLIGLDKSRNQKVIKDALETLVTSKITWNTLEKDKSKNTWGVCTFLAGAEVRNGKLDYLVNPYLSDKIVSPIVYAKIQLLIQAQFRSKYTLIMYEFIIDELSRKREKTLKVETELENLRKVLQYDGAYRSLNNDVLKPSIKEINEKTDVEVSIDTVKKGRRVVGIVFEINRKEQFQLSLELASRGLVDKLSEKQEQQKQLLIDYGITEQKATAIVLTYDSDRIQRNVNYLNQERKKDKTKIRNVPAYLVKAIELNYSPKPSIIELKEVERENKLQEQKQAEAEKKQLVEEQEQQFQSYRDMRLQEELSKKTKEWYETRVEQFVQRIQQKKYPVLVMPYKRDGMDSKIVKATFNSELKTELLSQPEEQSLEAYLAWAQPEEA